MSCSHEDALMPVRPVIPYGSVVVFCHDKLEAGVTKQITCTGKWIDTFWDRDGGCHAIIQTPNNVFNIRLPEKHATTFKVKEQS